MNMAPGASESGLSSAAKSRLLSSIHIMVNFMRSAKSSDDWTTNELFAFNIEVQPATPAALPELSVSETILDNF